MKLKGIRRRVRGKGKWTSERRLGKNEGMKDGMRMTRRSNPWARIWRRMNGRFGGRACVRAGVLGGERKRARWRWRKGGKGREGKRWSKERGRGEKKEW